MGADDGARLQVQEYSRCGGERAVGERPDCASQWLAVLQKRGARVLVYVSPRADFIWIFFIYLHDQGCSSSADAQPFAHLGLFASAEEIKIEVIRTA